MFANLKTEEPAIYFDLQNWRTRVTRVREDGSSKPRRPNLTQRCKRFATALTSTQVVVLPWRYYDAEMGTAITNTLRRNTAVKSLVFGLKFSFRAYQSFMS